MAFQMEYGMNSIIYDEFFFKHVTAKVHVPLTVNIADFRWKYLYLPTAITTKIFKIRKDDDDYNEYSTFIKETFKITEKICCC